MKRTFVIGILARCLAGVIGALFIGQAAAQPQGYPNKPIRFMVGFPPGGSTDIAARIIAAKLSERLGQSVVADNRSGASGIIGVDAIAKSEPDGYTIGFGIAGTLAISVGLGMDLPYKPLTDLAPISMAVNNTLILVANPSFPAKNVSELIALAKARPGKIVLGTSGTGTSMHLAGALLNLMAGIELVHAPYKGLGPAANDLLGGHTLIALLDVATTRDFIKQGRIKALGTTGAKRAQTAPEVPTIGESGVPGYAVTSWFGVIAPAQTPPEIVKLLNSHIVAILESAEVRERYFAAGMEPAPTTPEEFRNFIKSEITRWAKVIKEAGIVVR